MRFATALYVRPDADALGIEIRVQNTADKACEYAVTAFVDWVMGVDARDAAFLRAWNEDGVCLARGAAAGVGYLAALNAPAEAGAERAAFLGHGGVFKPDGLFERRGGKGGWALKARLSLRPGEERTLAFAVGRSDDRAGAPADGSGPARAPSRPGRSTGRLAEAPCRADNPDGRRGRLTASSPC